MTLQEAISDLVKGLSYKSDVSDNDFVLLVNPTTGEFTGKAKLKDIIAKYSGYKSFMEAGYNEEEVLNLVDEVLEE